MESLKIINEFKTCKAQQLSSEYDFNEVEVLQHFPQSRYFQIHFQNCHENADLTLQSLDELRAHVLSVEEKLDKILILLNSQGANS